MKKKKNGDIASVVALDLFISQYAFFIFIFSLSENVMVCELLKVLALSFGHVFFYEDLKFNAQPPVTKNWEDKKFFIDH